MAIRNETRPRLEGPCGKTEAVTILLSAIKLFMQNIIIIARINTIVVARKQ